MSSIAQTFMLFSIPGLISLSWLLGGNLISKLSPVALTSSRVAAGTIVLFFFSNIRKSQVGYTRSSVFKWWWEQLLLSITGRTIYFYLSTKSLLLITPFEAILISTLLPVFLLLLERISGRAFTSTLVPIGAVTSVGAVVGSLFAASPAQSFRLSLGHLEMALAMFSFAIHMILYRRFVKDTNPANPLFAQFFIATLMLLPMDTPGLTSLGDFSIAEWMQFFIYSVICNLLPFVLVHYCLRYFSAFSVGAVAILSPLFSFIIRGVSIREPPGLTFMLLSGVACALTYFTFRADQLRSTHPSSASDQGSH